MDLSMAISNLEERLKGMSTADREYWGYVAALDDLKRMRRQAKASDYEEDFRRRAKEM